MRKLLYSLAFLALALSGCNSDDNLDDNSGSPGTGTTGTPTTIGLYALSEGNMGGNNGQLLYFDYDSAKDTFVRNETKRFVDYGETPNDLLVYGAKMYCAITGTAVDGGLLRVINPTTGETIRDIDFTRNAVWQQPRRLAAAGGKVYITLYSGAVAQIDTVSLSGNVIGLNGTFSEGICAHGESLYICNSGQGVGNTISVVDMKSFTETATITVPYNPLNIVSAGRDELYFNTASVWSGPAAGDPANVHILNTAAKEVTHTFDLPMDYIAAGKDYVYGTAVDWESSGSILKKIAVANRSVSDFTADAEEYMLGYKLCVNPLGGDVFLTQMGQGITQMGQSIFRFKADGTFLETLQTGRQNGAAVAFVQVVK